MVGGGGARDDAQRKWTRDADESALRPLSFGRGEPRGRAIQGMVVLGSGIWSVIDGGWLRVRIRGTKVLGGWHDLARIHAGARRLGGVEVGFEQGGGVGLAEDEFGEAAVGLLVAQQAMGRAGGVVVEPVGGQQAHDLPLEVGVPGEAVAADGFELLGGLIGGDANLNLADEEGAREIGGALLGDADEILRLEGLGGAAVAVEVRLSDGADGGQVVRERVDHL